MVSATGISPQRRAPEKATTTVAHARRKTAARPTGKSAYTEIFGESLQRCRSSLKMLDLLLCRLWCRLVRVDVGGPASVFAAVRLDHAGKLALAAHPARQPGLWGAVRGSFAARSTEDRKQSDL
jgi:hypothetical protein